MTFTDRVPTYPGRVRLTPVTGQSNVYDLTRADQPTDPGTALNAAFFTAFQSDMAEYGTYTGNGTTASITFTFAPRAFFIICLDASSQGMAVWIKGAPGFASIAYNANAAHHNVTWNDNTVSWSGSTKSSMNSSGETYYYLALA